MERQYKAIWPNYAKSQLVRLQFLSNLIRHPKYTEPELLDSTGRDLLMPAVAQRLALDILLELQGWRNKMSNGAGYIFWTRPNINMDMDVDDVLVVIISYPHDRDNGKLGWLGTIMSKDERYDSEPYRQALTIEEIIDETDLFLGDKAFNNIC